MNLNKELTNIYVMAGKIGLFNRQYSVSERLTALAVKVAIYGLVLFFITIALIVLGVLSGELHVKFY